MLFFEFSKSGKGFGVETVDAVMQLQQECIVGLTYSTPRRDAPSPEMPHIKSRPDYSGAWDLEFMQDISGKGASRLGVEYVSLVSSS